VTDGEGAWLTQAPWGITDRVAARLAVTAREVAAEWGVPLGERLQAGRYSFVAFAGTTAVLKVTPIEDDEADHEADALVAWDGDGAVRLLRHDRARRAMLIARARPGTDASALSEADAVGAAVAVGRRLWCPAKRGRPFRWIGDEVQRWLGQVPDHELVRHAKDVFASMTVGDATLLHGDFHHHNLLRHDDRWLAIDPKPYVGEPEYDVAPFFWNPIGSVVTPERTKGRIAAFAACGLDQDRVRKWAIVRGAYLAFPLGNDESEESSPQLQVVRALL
jgi:streptomycin 6-kinase